MAWNEAAVTNSGLELIEKSVFGGKTEIISVVGGERTVPAEALAEMKNILLPRHDMEITGIERLDYGVKVRVRLHNIGVRASYRLRQIGLFAKLEGSGGEPVLLAVIQDGEGEEIPAEADNPEYLLEFNFVIPISNEANITAVLKSDIFATLDDIYNHTHPAMIGATEYLAGISGFVPEPMAGEQEKFLRADGTWQYVPKVHSFSERIRDKTKPDYGFEGSGEFKLILNTGEYTGNAEIAVVHGDNSLLDAENMTRNAETARHGDFIVKGE